MALADCAENNLIYDQAVAMIDKYFVANPEKWSVPLGNGIVLALTVKGGPCAGIDPWK